MHVKDPFLVVEVEVVGKEKDEHKQNQKVGFGAALWRHVKIYQPEFPHWGTKEIQNTKK